jgi:tetratricopeptide (TPR) repeat protein
MSFPHLVKASDFISLYKDTIVNITVNNKNGRQVDSGNGFIVGEDGIIVTTCSVLSGWYQDVQNTMTVAIPGKEAIPLDDVLSYNCRRNVALIKINAKGLPSLKLAIDHKFKKGEDVIVLSPFESGSKVTRSKIISISGEFSKTTATVTPEMSGSPVLTGKGEVIGIATFLLKKEKKLSVIIAAQEIKNRLVRYRKYVKRFQTVRTPSSRPHISSERIVSEKGKTQIAEKPDDILNHYLIGCDQMRQQMYTDAIESFKESIIMKPDDGEAYVNLGNVYYKLGSYDDATYSYREAIRITPRDLSLYNKLGTVLIILGEYKQAIDVFKEAVNIDSKNAEAYFNLGIAYFLDGDKSDVTNVQKILKELDMNRAQSLFELLD